MQLRSLLATAATFAVAQAKVQFDNSAFVVTAGQPFNFTWSGAEGAVSLLLKDGPATNLSTVETIASGLSGTSYQWAVPSTLVQNTYAFEIDDGTAMNYSPQFQLIGGVASSATTMMTSTTGSSSSSAMSSTMTPSSNATTSSGGAASKTGGGSSTTGAKTSSATTPASTTSAPSSANGLSSPLAFVFLALAAFFTLN